jgi:DNA-binding transcriptional LysR family regulator
VELRHLRYFVAVAEELHFRRAAARLHMSQPPLSQQIRQLEEEVGVQLLTRNQRGVELTTAGRSFYERAVEILQATDDAVREARRVERGEVGRLAVGFVGSSMYSVVPEFLRAFRARFEQVDLRLRELSTAAQLEALRNGRIDVGFIRPWGQIDGVMVQTVLRERVVAAVPDSHPLAASSRLRLEDVAAEPLVLIARREAPGLHDAIFHSIALAGGVAGVVQETAEMQTVIGLVAAGVGVTLVPESVRSLARSGVTYRPLIEELPSVELAVAWRPENRSPVLSAFLATVAEGRVDEEGIGAAAPA